MYRLTGNLVFGHIIMFLVKLCVVLFVFAITGTCQSDTANSSPPMRLPPASGWQHEQVAALRRQLMRDNYDYTQSDDERKHPNVTARRGDTTNIYYQKGNMPASEAAQTNSKSYSAEHGQDEEPGEDKQVGQYEEQPGQYEQPGDYVQRSQHEQPGQNEQLGQNEHYGQNEQPGEKEQYGQNEQPGQYVQRSQPGHDSQHDQYEQEGERSQYDTRPKPGPLSEQEQPDQQFEDQDQTQYDEQTFRSKPAYIDTDELTIRDVNDPKHTLDRSYTDQVRERGTNPAWDDPNPTREDTNSARPETEPPRRHKEPARESAYQPFYNKHPKAYETNRGVALPARPFSDLRGDFIHQNQRGDTNSARRETEPPRRYKEPVREPAYQPFYNKHPKANESNRGVALQARPFSDLRGDFGAGVKPEHQEHAENDENDHEDQEAIDQQNISDSQDDGSDYSESKKQSREMYNEFGHTTRTSRLQPSAGRGTSHRGHSLLTYQEPDTPSGNHHATQDRHHKAPPGRDHYRPSHRDRNTPHQQDRKAPPEINIAKKDLLYYMDDTQLRRNYNEMSPDDEEYPLSSAGPSSSALRPSPTLARATPTRPRASSTAARTNPTLAQSSPTVARANPTSPRANSASTKRPDFLSTNRAHRSSFVTVSPTNVTYKLLTLKSREGRRRAERRILEERRPEGVAIMSLDHAPLPGFRLPRARRQYMHEHQRRSPQPV